MKINRYLRKINSRKDSHKKPLEQLSTEEIGQLEIEKQFF